MKLLSPLNVLLTLGLLLTMPLSPGRAQAPAPSKSQPDVLVLVFAVPGGPDQIGLTYPTVVPHAQAMRDVHAIQTATGWKITGIHIADQLPPVQRAKGKMTGVDFVAPGALSPASHLLPLGPFVESLRSYHHVTLMYVMDQGFGFEGLRQFTDNHINIALDQRGSTYTYNITIRDGHFGHLNLPQYQLSDANARAAQANVASHRAGTPWLVALIALAAVGAGCVVYAFLARNV